MDATEIFTTALEYEQKIRDLYREATERIDDERGKAIFRALADDEQSHVDFLLYSLDQLKANGTIDASKLNSPVPTAKELNGKVEKLKAQIPERMLGDIKTVLNSALKLEQETSDYYSSACEKAEGEIKTILEKFLEIENRHLEVVQIELDHAMNSGMWFDFMETSLEIE